MNYCYTCCCYTEHPYMSGHVKTIRHTDAIFYDKELTMEQDSTDNEHHIVWRNSDGKLHREGNRPAHIILYKLKGVRSELRRNQCEPYTLLRGATFQKNKCGKWFIVRKEYWRNGALISWEGAIAPGMLPEFTSLVVQTTFTGHNA